MKAKTTSVFRRGQPDLSSIQGFRKGFTLAEVLITLGIIGVIAALTLPSLIADYKKKVWVTQLKKAYSVSSNAFKKMLTDEGVEDLRDTGLFRALPESGMNPQPLSSEQEAYFRNIFSNIVEIRVFGHMDEYWNQNLNEAPKGCANNPGCSYYPYRGLVITTADGALYNFEGSSFSGNIIRLNIDVNGRRKGPNIYARDVFTFEVAPNGRVTPLYASDLCEKDPYDFSGSPSCGAYHVIKDGWVMNY